MSDAILDAMCDLIQHDVNGRGLRTDQVDNLVTASLGDFAAACRSLARQQSPALAVVTGFPIPHAEPPCYETDGPLGAVFLARALVPLGIPVALVTDEGVTRALEAGLEEAGLPGRAGVRVHHPPGPSASAAERSAFWRLLSDESGGPQPHLVALERAGPSHTRFSVERHPQSHPAHAEAFEQVVPEENRNQCHTMRGRVISHLMRPAHELFEEAAKADPPVPTIGIGDGGNEIGMGRLSWDLIRRNIQGGGVVACRVPTDYLIVCGVSNWGAYALAAGVRLLRGAPVDRTLFDPDVERRILQAMVERGPLVDGVTGRPTVSVDGLSFERYIEPLVRIGQLLLAGR